MTGFASYRELAELEGRSLPAADRPVVCVQGLGFVGAAMALAVASARNPEGKPTYDVVGVELPTHGGRSKVDAVNGGRLPMTSSDETLVEAMQHAFEAGNFIATTREEAFKLANVSLIDIHFDVQYRDGEPTVCFDNLRTAVRTLATHMVPGSLIVVETTVPPGTCQKVLAPEIQRVLQQRGLPADAVLLAHSYERVMPGKDYLSSIVNFWRVYAGHTPEAARACERFLSTIVNTRDYPLTRLESTAASEMGKILENSYRATTIAFMEEWGRFAEALGVDIFEVIQAIRRRPTHSNMRQPGFGVGGYCLTKDPLFAEVAARELFGLSSLRFPFCRLAVATNNVMPLVTLDKMRELLGGSLRGKSILLHGVRYRHGAGDTRYSPSETFVRRALEEGARVSCHDPLIEYWAEVDMALPNEIPAAQAFDAIVFAVPHDEYVDLDLVGWLGGATPLIIDSNEVLKREQREALAGSGCRIWSIGRGVHQQ